ncbi:MAG: hypothetical protein P4L46_25380 [Fimbriimonas sp.]|nr:hypothetical protein [Fimbriimonas sp.]
MNKECWLEIDLYWFQGEPPQVRAHQLFERLLPLWGRSPATRTGLSLCVGWLFDMVLYWNGDPDEVIPCCQSPTYEEWTYRRLAELVTEIKQEAVRRGMPDFHVALLLMGIETQSFPESACEGWSGRTEEQEDKARYDIEGRWFFDHPEVYDDRFDIFFFGAPVKVPNGETICRQQRPTFGEYFADKLAAVTRTVGFDAVVLRDHIFTRAYIRGNRKARYMAPASREAWNEAIIAMLARVKSHDPNLIMIGYSSGTSSIEEWRSHGFDLERVARSGHLDLWITQTWASAWGDYWPAHSMGFTFQLMNALVHQAMLADTPCKHLFLVETFDAWEPWDSIHQYPSKVAWEIWAYSHASVLLPGGRVARSAGCYIAWMNRRENLLPEDTVTFLRETLGAAAVDIEREPIPDGPCIVYSRKAMEASLAEPAAQSRGEEIDDWAAMLAKFGAPILSITRAKWLTSVTADGYICPLASKLTSDETNFLRHEVSAGKPLLLIGEAARIDEKLRDALGIAIESEPRLASLPSAAIVEQDLACRIGTSGLLVNQRRRTLADSDGIRPLISNLDGPIFAKAVGQSCWVWETPEWGTPFILHMTNQSIQSPQTYLAVATAIGERGWGTDAIRWENEDWTRPICFLSWRYASGERTILLANLETGVTGSSQFCVSGTLSTPTTAVDSTIGMPGKMAVAHDVTRISLGAHRACLLASSPGSKSDKPNLQTSQGGRNPQ